MTTFDRLRKILISSLGVNDDKITPDARLLDDLGADSLDVIEVAMHAEDEFGIHIPDEKVRELQTVRDAVDLIDTLKAAGA